MKLNILFLSYTNMNDTRTNALYCIAHELGNVFCVVHSNYDMPIQNLQKNDVLFTGIGFKTYFRFVLKCIKTAIEVKPDIVIIDNRKAAVPGVVVKHILKETFFIQDVKEYYILSEAKSISSFFGCLFEKMMIKHSNFLICANEHRAKLMKNYYRLVRNPYVFENIFMLTYNQDELCDDNFDSKYGKLFSSSKLHLISTAGCSLEREADKVVKAVGKKSELCSLILVGGGSSREVSIIKQIIEEQNFKNIHVLERVNKSTLRRLIQNSDIGITTYAKHNLNNLYCASGKIYEYMYEGKPFLASSNPPLKEICEKYNIGISTDDYAEGIDKIIEKIDELKKNVIEYMSVVRSTDYSGMLLSYIEKEYSEYETKTKQINEKFLFP